MTEIFKLALSLSLSGSVLATVIFACCRLMRNRLSKRFQYYIWLVVVVRLLVPFSPDSAIIPRLWEPAPPVQVMPDNTVTAPTEQQSMPPYQSQTQPAETQSRPDGIVQQPVESQPTPAAPPMPQQESSVIVLFQAVWPYLWILWLAVAAGLMIRKITLYQSFVKYLRAGRIEVDDIETLDRFSALSEQMGVRRAIDLYTNRLTASPLILGFRKSAVVLPEIPVNSEEFRFICLHELTHYKRGDIWYKWILQIVLCLHWFNPLVHLMVREVNRLCELSCDEAVLQVINAGERRQYGDTLLQSLQTPGTYREGLAALTLNESAHSLKERLESIMKFTKPNKATAVLAVFLAALLFTGGYTLGAYTVKPQAARQEENSGVSPEGLPIMSADNREIYEKYLQRIYVTGLFRVDFSPEDPTELRAYSGDIMRSVFAAIYEEPLTDIGAAIPASQVEAILTAKLPVDEWMIKDEFSDVYDATTDTYELYGGLGGGPSTPIVTGSVRQGDLLTVYYTWYDSDPAADEFRYAASDSGTLIIRLTKDDYQYVSNKITPSLQIDSDLLEANDKLDELKPEILPVLQALITDYDSQIDNLNFTAVPDYFALTELDGIDDFSLTATETGLKATIDYAGASQWQMEVLLSNFDGIYRAEGASFSIIPDSFMGKAMARGLTYTQVKTLIHSSFLEEEILSMPIEEIRKIFAQFSNPDNNSDGDAFEEAQPGEAVGASPNIKTARAESFEEISKPNLDLSIQSANIQAKSTVANQIFVRYDPAFYSADVVNTEGNWSVEIKSKLQNMSGAPTVTLYLPDIEYGDIKLDLELAVMSLPVAGGNITANAHLSDVILELRKDFVGSVNYTSKAGTLNVYSSDRYANSQVRITNDTDIMGDISVPDAFTKNGNEYTYNDGTRESVINVTLQEFGAVVFKMGTPSRFREQVPILEEPITGTDEVRPYVPNR